MWVLLSGCDATDAIEPTLPPSSAGVTTEPPAAAASARAVHLALGLGAVDVYVDDARWVGPLGYLSGTGDVSLPAGAHTVSIVPSGADLAQSVAAVQISVGDAERVSLAVFGPAPSPTVLAFAGDATPQVVHASPAHPEISVWDLPGLGRIADLRFSEVVSLTLPGGGLALDHDADGGTDEVYDVPPLPPGAALYITCADDTPFLVHQGVDGALTVVEAGARGEVRVVHAAPASPPLDLWLDPTPAPVVGPLSFADASPYVAVRPGTIEVAASGAAPSAGTWLPVDLAADARVSLIAADGDPILVADDEAEIGRALVRLRVTHAAPDLGPIDLLDTYSLAALVAGLAAGEAVSADTLPGPYTLGLDDDGDGLFEATFEVPYLGTAHLVEMVVVRERGAPKLVIVFPDATTWLLNPEGWF